MSAGAAEVAPVAVGGETAGDLIRSGAARLAAAGVPDARRDARLLLALVLDLEAAEVLVDPQRPVSGAAQARYAALLAQRAARVPVSRLLGAREFWSLPLRLTPATLDPRPDSETLVAAVLAARPERAAPLRLLDLGTGSGCLLLALLSEYPAATGVGVDRDPAAAAAAAANARRLGLGARAAFLAGDWDDALAQRFDVVVTNPPYLSAADLAAAEPEVRAHDPYAALDGGLDGLAAYRALAPRLAERLGPDGLAALELGADQGPAVAALLAEAGLAVTNRACDLAGRERCLIATPARSGHFAREKSVGPRGNEG